MESTVCNCCGSSSAHPLYTLPDYALGRSEPQWRLVQCSQCGLVYQNPRPTLAEMAQHYPPHYESYQLGQSRRTGRLARWAFDYGMWKRSRFVTRTKRRGSLLDIGCATGEFLDYMQRLGTWQVCGVEINPDVAQTARLRYGLDVFAGTLHEAAYPDKQFDAVTLGDVLEHVHDPSALLRETARILKDDGIVVIRTPNLAGWSARLAGRYWAGLDAPRHLYVFSAQTLAQLLLHNGLAIAHETSAQSDYAFLVLTVEFWLTARGVSPQTKQRLTRLLAHPLIRLAGVPLFALPARMLQGSMLVTTAIKTTSRVDSSASLAQEKQD